MKKNILFTSILLLLQLSIVAQQPTFPFNGYTHTITESKKWTSPIRKTCFHLVPIFEKGEYSFVYRAEECGVELTLGTKLFLNIDNQCTYELPYANSYRLSKGKNGKMYHKFQIDKEVMTHLCSANYVYFDFIKKGESKPYALQYNFTYDALQNFRNFALENQLPITERGHYEENDEKLFGDLFWAEAKHSDNLKISPSEDSNILVPLIAGEFLAILSERPINGYYFVSTASNRGFIKADNVTLLSRQAVDCVALRNDKCFIEGEQAELVFYNHTDHSHFVYMQQKQFDILPKSELSIKLPVGEFYYLITTSQKHFPTKGKLCLEPSRKYEWVFSGGIEGYSF